MIGIDSTTPITSDTLKYMMIVSVGVRASSFACPAARSGEWLDQYPDYGAGEGEPGNGTHGQAEDCLHQAVPQLDHVLHEGHLGALFRRVLLRSELARRFRRLALRRHC